VKDQDIDESELTNTLKI